MRACVFNLPVSMTSPAKVFLFCILGGKHTEGYYSLQEESLFCVTGKKIKLLKICTLEISKKNIHFPVLFYFYPLTKVKLSSNQQCMKKHVLTV